MSAEADTTIRGDHGRARRGVVAGVVAVLAVSVVLAPATTAADGERVFTGGTVRVASDGLAPPDTPALREKRARGYLVRDPAAYNAAKAAAAGQARPGEARPGGPLAPTIGLNFAGVNDTGVTPPDTTGAVGTSRYIELVNRMYGIYDKTGGLLQSGTLATLTGIAGTSLFDVQIVWDPDTDRFYYLMDDVEAGGNFLAFGFSTTASPSGSADFCKYVADFGYGTDFPDYPKLGTTGEFLVIGVNTFNSLGAYIGSDILTITKPGAGTSCPSAGTFTLNAALSVNNANGTDAWTPVPAVQTDPDSNGWVVSTTEAITDNELTIFKVSGTAPTSVIETTGRSAPVSMYTAPPNAPQSGTTKALDTLDGRNTQAVAGINPSAPTAPQVIWTQHTIDNGTTPTGRSFVRWYEINPRPGLSSPIVYQEEDVSDSSLYVLNGAVSPDRRVNGSGRAFGNASAVIFNTSSGSSFPAIYAQTSTLMGSPSPWLLIKQSPGFNQDFSCDTEPVCRWGDYAAATPDPGADTSRAHGIVWFTNEWNVASSTTADVDWRTQNGSVNVDESFGFLRVTSSPALPTQILVDGQIMDNWGLTWVKLPVGAHTVSFTDVEGYTTPADIPVVITEGNTTTATGTFVQRGLLRVLTSPAVAGTVSIDGVRRNDWGVWTWLPTGLHQVCFGAVADFLAPSCQDITLAAGSGNADVTGTYTSSPGASGEGGTFGFVRTTTSPALPSQILLDGNIMDNWGLTWVKSATGGHTVSFTDVEGYTTPANQPITVTNGNTNTVTGTFVQRGLLRVLTSPAVAGTVHVNGLPRNDWGVWTWFPTGSVSVCFENAPGFTAPPCQIATLTAGNQTTVTGTYAANG